MGSVITSSPFVDELTSSQAFNLLFTFVGLATLMPFMLHMYYEYLAFVALGPGGTPPTLAGFFRVKLLSLFALRDPYQPAPIPERFHDAPGYLVDLAKRSPPRPCTKGIAPHRQVTQKPSAAEYQKLASAIEGMGNLSEKLVIGTSCFEKHGTGLFSISPAKPTCRGEICHAHPSDGSMHMTLHPADAKAVLEAGWGERHPLARGGWFERFVPGGFIMVYAPRSDEEVQTVLQITRAAAWFVSGGDGVKDLTDERRDSGYASAEDKSCS